MILTYLAAIFFISMLFVIVKYFQVFNINNLQGLTINYIAAAACYYFYSNQPFQVIVKSANHYFPFYIISGLLFITVFYLTSLSSQQNGVAVATIASKMSVVIPVVAGVYLYRESISLIKVIGLLVALLAVYLSAYRPNTIRNERKQLLPLWVFIGAGLVDTSIKLIQHTFDDQAGSSVYFLMLFISAAIIGILLSAFHIVKSNHLFEIKNMVAGLILGTCNFASLYFLVAALHLSWYDSGKTFMIINCGVVMLNSILSAVLFREPQNIKNRIGTGLAVAAIIILSF
jgi:drug/metabolite transporter (DMT)-like permease